jgi:hypothetical protein
MTLDAIDAAFIDRWQASLPPLASAPVAANLPREEPVAIAVDAPTVATVRPADDFVERLLAAAVDAWNALADEVVAARGRGHRAIALVSCERGAGCSTLAEGLRRVLGGRGRDTMTCTPASIPDTGPTHDKRILLVDGGVWFPPGRIHRQRLLVASTGCDAAILVVRSGHAPPAAWSTSLEAIGVEPLGEVISFVPASSIA